jgi:hypothetical protein
MDEIFCLAYTLLIWVPGIRIRQNNMKACFLLIIEMINIKGGAI